MADSERPRDRDDDVPEPRRGDRKIPPAASEGGDVPRCGCHAEPDRGTAPSGWRDRVIAEVVFWLIRIVLTANGNDG